MIFHLEQHNISQLLVPFGIEREIVLYYDNLRRVLLSVYIYVDVSCIFLHYRKKYLNFIRWFYQAKHFVWHRYLYFIRAVGRPTPVGCSHIASGVG